jgi:hypothetical protein
LDIVKDSVPELTYAEFNALKTDGTDSINDILSPNAVAHWDSVQPPDHRP